MTARAGLSANKTGAGRASPHSVNDKRRRNVQGVAVARYGCSMTRTRGPPRRRQVRLPGEVALPARPLTIACESDRVEAPDDRRFLRLMPRGAAGLPRDSRLLTAQLELDHDRLAGRHIALVPAVPSRNVRPRDQLDRRLTDTAKSGVAEHSALKHCVATICATQCIRLAYEEDDDAAGAGFVVMEPDPVACDWATSLAW